MVTSRTPLLFFLMKLLIVFQGQQQVKCDVTAVAIDTCSLNAPGTLTYPIDTSRAITPNYAGREGLDFAGRDSARISIPNAMVFNNMKKDCYSLKFYMKLERAVGGSQLFQFAGVGLHQRPNDTLQLAYTLMNHGELEPKLYLLETPTNATESHLEVAKDDRQSENDASDWIQLTGIKVKSLERKERDIPSERKKRELPSEKKKREIPDGQVKEYHWMMIGYDYEGYSSGSSHLNVYINGKIVYSRNFTENQYLHRTYVDSGHLVLTHAKFSCMEYGKGVQNATYFQDLKLHKCVKKYSAQPEKKFVDCERNLSSSSDDILDSFR